MERCQMVMTGKGWSECSPEEREEIVKDAIRKGRELTKRLKNRLTCKNLRLAERYLNGELKLHVHMVRVADPAEYCAVIYGAHRILDFDSWRDFKEFGGRGNSSNIEDRTAHAGIGDDQSPVLIRIVQFVERPKLVVPQFVGFDAAENIHDGLFSGLYMSAVGPMKTIGRRVDREATALSLRFPPAIGEHQAAPEMVKAASEIVNRVGSNRPEASGRLGSDGNAIDLVPPIRITLASDRIGVGLVEGFDRGFKVADVLFGPVDLDPNAGRAISHAS